MRKNLCVGILRETKKGERRVPLTPLDVSWLVERGIRVEVESSHKRVFSDADYRQSGAKVLRAFKNASLMVGVKEPRVADVDRDKIYMFFSHTAKGQFQNVPLLMACLKKRVTLIDYEKIVDSNGGRLVYFGRFAGICGLVDSLCYLGKKLEWKGIKNPLALLQPAYKYGSLDEVRLAMVEAGERIRRQGFYKGISPFIIGITGHGNVSKGAQEVLDLLDPIEIYPGDMRKFIRLQKEERDKIYKVVFFREEKLRAKDGKGFYFEEYLEHPERFESNMDVYLSYLNVLVHTSYWDSRYPRLVTREMIEKLARGKNFRLEFIGDISCDINGSIEITCKSCPSNNATFTYNPRRKVFTNGYKAQGITVMAVDNLPAELPREASVEFSSLIRDYLYQVSTHGAKDVTNHIALPVEIRMAVITQQGQLTEQFGYLRKYINVRQN